MDSGCLRTTPRFRMWSWWGRRRWTSSFSDTGSSAVRQARATIRRNEFSERETFGWTPGSTFKRGPSVRSGKHPAIDGWIHPEHRLANGVIANHFLHCGFGIQTPPQGEILGFVESQTCKQQALLANRPLIKVFDVGLVRPFLFVSQVRVQKGYGLTHGAAIGQVEGPEIVAVRRKHLADSGKYFEIEKRITVGLGAGEFEWETAIGRHLAGYQNRFEAPAAIILQRGIADISGELGDLKHPSAAVIVLCVALLFTVW